MATSTLPYKGIKINGNRLNGDMTSRSAGIGTTVVNPANQTKSVTSTSTKTLFTGRELTAGTWLINVCAYFQKTVSSGNIWVGLCDSGGSVNSYSQICCGGTGSGLPRLNLFTVLALSSATTVYPAVYQQSGQTMDVLIAFHAMRI